MLLMEEDTAKDKCLSQQYSTKTTNRDFFYSEADNQTIGHRASQKNNYHRKCRSISNRML